MVWVILLLVLFGCSTLPTDYARESSIAFHAYDKTRLGKVFSAGERAHPGTSGVTILPNGRDAFIARIAMTQTADKSLDLQYYIWDKDETGQIMALALLEAADRGVRVRVLLDDMNLKGRDDVLAALDAHPNIEIRMFNPFGSRGVRAFEFLGEFDRLNHRMHNKIFIADNAVALLGGRNIGNHYFDVATDINYRDLDVVSAGPAVRDASEVYDYFWNGDWSIPIAALVAKPYDQKDLEAARAELENTVREKGYPHPVREEASKLRQRLDAIARNFVWAPAQVVWDDPQDFRDGSRGKIISALEKKLQSLKSELLIENAYFVPRERGTAVLADLVSRGVGVRVLTNSLSSNDVIAAHAGYAKYRKPLLQAGVSLHEVRAESADVQQSLVSVQSRAGLHTKAAVFDGESVFIGSFNLDPRSANINTEIGLYVESRVMAKRLTAFLDEGVAPANSYRLELDTHGNLVWISQFDGKIVRYRQEPETKPTQRFLSGVIGALPIESQL